MTSEVRSQKSEFRSLIALSSIALAFLWVSSCSIPNLEPQQCIDSRTTIREFYSQHFGNNLDFSPAGIEGLSRFLTPRFLDELKSQHPTTDPFTLMDDPPKAFRVSECKVTESGVRFNVLLFWKTDERSEQRSITVDVEKHGDKWLVDRVSR